jgi:hypothetical protein
MKMKRLIVAIVLMAVVGFGAFGLDYWSDWTDDQGNSMSSMD